MSNQKQTFGLLIMTMLVASGVFYVQYLDQARIRVDDDKSTFYVPHEDNSWMWVVSGREYNYLFDGSSRLNRDVSGIKVRAHYEDDLFIVERVTPYKRGPIIYDKYIFKKDTEDITQFPINHTITILNGQGYFYRYEVRDLVYDGPRRKLNGTETELSFGRNMKVTLNPGYRWSWFYSNGVLRTQYDIEDNITTFNVRLFDPPPVEKIPVSFIDSCIPKNYTKTETIRECNTTTVFNEVNQSYSDVVSCTTTENNITSEECRIDGDYFIDGVKINPGGFTCTLRGSRILECDYNLDSNNDGKCSPQGGETCLIRRYFNATEYVESKSNSAVPIFSPEKNSRSGGYRLR